jgi:hypothetical protein
LSPTFFFHLASPRQWQETEGRRERGVVLRVTFSAGATAPVAWLWAPAPLLLSLAPLYIKVVRVPSYSSLDVCHTVSVPLPLLTSL